jgi:hypothetical protein
VTVGASICPIVAGTLTITYLECTLPGMYFTGGTGTVDVEVTVAGSTVYAFERGYRYIQRFRKKWLSRLYIKFLNHFLDDVAFKITQV